ncbi:hypothetical protein B0I37DRAFT_353061 [Chaetomium sp. MPI-CAGE-AT-0009]|nr:hypothetical protein B0I37DRAFT_353061 [Chaetomium sp. MPI-CAGE-AT-0009]
MIFIILFLVSFLQVAHCGPLPVVEPRTSCFITLTRPVESECRQVIDAFSHHDPTGYITLEGNHAFRIWSGRCSGTLINKSSSPYAVNADQLTIIMNNYILDRCVVSRQWGFYETDRYIIELAYTDEPVKDGGLESKDYLLSDRDS